jgi:mannose-6-phosphate isomerase
MTTPAAPIMVRPLLDAKPWGGRRLEAYGVDLGNRELIGEALLTAPVSTVISGEFTGATLAEIAREAPEVWIGKRGLRATGGREVFPLLVKLIDAHADLSIQVHPDDRAAAAASLGTGKTEAWHVLDAQPGSVLYVGLRPEVDPRSFTTACLDCDGTAASYLRQIPAVPGITVVVPAGTPHAIGAGCMIYEIQQPSNVTFRLDDWGRVDTSGQPRELHHDLGFAALIPHSRPAPNPRITLSEAPRRELLAATRYFALERIALESSASAAFPGVDSPHVLTLLSGAVTIIGGGWRGALHPGETMVVPAAFAGTLSARQPSVVLRGWVPDIEQDVIHPASAVGASREAIAQLGILVGTP